MTHARTIIKRASTPAVQDADEAWQAWWREALLEDEDESPSTAAESPEPKAFADLLGLLEVAEQLAGALRLLAMANGSGARRGPPVLSTCPCPACVAVRRFEGWKAAWKAKETGGTGVR